MKPSASMLDDVDFEDALGEMMSTLNEDTIDGLVSRSIEQAEQEASAEPIGSTLSHFSIPPTTDELEAIEHAAQVGSWMEECGFNSTNSDDRLPLMDYTADADRAATPKDRFLIQ